MKFNVEGIVIRQSPYKEKDAMISALTPDGIVSFLARSVLLPAFFVRAVHAERQRG